PRIELRSQPDQSDLAGVGSAAEHRLAEECGTKGNAVEPTDQDLVVPDLHRVGNAAPVQLRVGRHDLPCDPSAPLAASGCSAGGDDGLESLVHAGSVVLMA